MPQLLFVDACVRGPALSRTHQLCRAFLEESARLHPGWEMQTVSLDELALRPLTAQSLDARETALQGGPAGQPQFGLARQFAAADRIVVGAPYWDLSFPACLKTYVEHISVRDVTFAFENNAIVGRCAAASLLYVTSCGGALAGQDYGAAFFRGACRQFGIPAFRALSVDGLDLEGADIDALMQDGLRRARKMAHTF